MPSSSRRTSARVAYNPWHLDGPPLSDERPLAIVSEIGNRRLVVATCELARAGGVKAGMSLAEANVVCPGLTKAAHEPARDAVALVALARWMAMRFTPIVAVEPPDALFLEIGGCERLFGGIEAIVERVREGLRAFRINARLAIAATPGAAWAFAQYGTTRHPERSEGASSDRISARTNDAAPVVTLKMKTLEQFTMTMSKPCAPALPHPSSSEDSSLASLPPAALRLAPAIAEALTKLGVTTIRQLAGLPRDALPSRFGKELLLRLDQALGRVPEPLVAVECRTPIVASREWDGPVESLEALECVLDELIVEAIAALERRGEGARRIEVTLRCPYAPAIHRAIALSRASRDVKNLRRLLRCMLEAIEAVEGFSGIKLRVATAERIKAARQASLVDVERESAEDEVERLVERLKIRLGDAALERAELVESHLPERAVRYDHVGATLASAKRSARPKTGEASLASTIAPARPLKLLPSPLMIGVMVAPSGDREGHPILFTHESRVHRMRTVVGPERVASHWWSGHDKTRDYFDVTDEEGRRFWIFRVIETWKWFLHGVF